MTFDHAAIKYVIMIQIFNGKIKLILNMCYVFHYSFPL